MWTWSQSKGELRRDGTFVMYGYSGNGRGLNNPAMEAVRGIGPIPVGKWTFVAIATDNHTGPYSLIIMPKPGTDTKGRTGFRAHGDNVKLDHSASHGCLIIQRALRVRIWTSGDHDLEVIP